MDTILRIDTLRKLVAENAQRDWGQYGAVNVKFSADGLVLFDYAQFCQQKKLDEWNFFERISRGLILDARTGEVVARPFDKFWNWGQMTPPSRQGSDFISEISEKLDGSLGTAYWRNGKWHVATRGSFESDQAQWATQYLHEHHPTMSMRPVTLLFEIIYPANRIVVDYGGWQGLALIGVRDPRTGVDYFRRQWKSVLPLAWLDGFRLPDDYALHLADMEAVLAHTQQLSANEEGFVVRMADGTRYKIKGAEYLRLHRFIFGFSFVKVAQAYLDGTLSEMEAVCPAHYREMFDDWCEAIDERVTEIQEEVQRLVGDAPKSSRKDAAIWVREHHPELAVYFFAALDGKSLLPLICKHEFGAKEAAHV